MAGYCADGFFGRPPARFQHREKVLQEVELLVAVLKVKSSRSGAAFAPFVPNGGLARITSNFCPVIGASIVS